MRIGKSVLRVALLAATLLVAHAPAGCSPSATAVDANARVAITITPPPDELPFDPRAARLSAAARQLADVAGHAVSLDVDAAMVPALRSRFEEALGEAFENMARDLEALKKASPEVFAYGVPLLEHVSVRYDAAATRDSMALDPASRTLTVRGPARRKALVELGIVSDGLGLAFGTHVTSRFASATPDAVPPGERRSYFKYLTGDVLRRETRSEGAPDHVAELASSPHAARILAVVRLAELSGSDPVLARDIQRWLVEEIEWFVGQYRDASALVRQLPADCMFRRAEAVYSRWLLAFHPTADAATRLVIERALFTRSWLDQQNEQGTWYSPFAWPGIDRFAFGLRVVDAWRAAGHPTPRSAKPSDPAHAFIVCPFIIERGRHSTAECEQDWYRFALEGAESRKRLAAALLERNDPLFAETAFVAMRFAGRKQLETTLTMLRAVEARPELWSAGMRVLMEVIDEESDIRVLEEAQRLWLEHADPRYRGPILFLLAKLDRENRGAVDWRGFREAFSGQVSAAELESYLGQGTSATELLPVVWPAIDKRVSRAAHVVPKLDAMVDEAEKTRSGRAYTALRGMVGRLCAEKNVSELGMIRAYVLQRAARSPGERYAALADDATSSRCKPAPPSPPPHHAVRLVSGKERLRIIQREKRGDDAFADRNERRTRSQAL